MQKETFSPLAFVAALWKKDIQAIAATPASRASPTGMRQSSPRSCTSARGPSARRERTGFAARFDGWMGQVMAVALPTRFHV